MAEEGGQEGQEGQGGGDDAAAKVEELSRQLAAVRQEAAERRIALKAWTSLGVEPDAVKQLLEDANRAREEAAKKSGQYEKILEEKEARWKADLTKTSEKLTRMETVLDKTLRESTSKAALAEAGGSVRLLLPHVQGRTALEQTEEGEYRVVVLDDSGKRRFNAAGEPMTVAELVAEMKEDPEFMGAFAGRGASGGGTPGTGGRHGGQGRVRTKADLKTPAEKSAYIAEHGLEAFTKLPVS